MNFEQMKKIIYGKSLYISVALNQTYRFFVLDLFVVAQVENYGPVLVGKHRKSLERGSSIPTGNFSDFFR
jgi:hypothetical protein